MNFKKSISYGRQYISWKDIWQVAKYLRSDFLTQGPTVKKFEEALAFYTGAKYAVAVSNGTAALHLAALACDINLGDECITTPNTFVATANSILYANGIVKLADIEPTTACIDIENIKKQISFKTKVIIVVHFAGQSCDMEPINKLAKEHNLLIIEDAAHAIGSEYKNKKVGSCAYSDMTTFSFHPVKNITTGEGGAITTNDPKIYEKLLALRSHGIIRDEQYMTQYQGSWYYEQQQLGFNYRLTDFQAALGVSQLNQIEKFITRRRNIVDIYKELFANDNRFSFLQEKDYAKSAFHLCPLLIDFDNLKINKKELFIKAKQNNINLQVHYIPVHFHPYYQKLGFKNGDFPVAEQFYKKTVSLPLYYGLKDREIYYVVKTFKELVK